MPSTSNRCNLDHLFSQSTDYILVTQSQACTFLSGPSHQKLKSSQFQSLLKHCFTALSSSIVVWTLLCRFKIGRQTASNIPMASSNSTTFSTSKHSAPDLFHTSPIPMPMALTTQHLLQKGHDSQERVSVHISDDKQLSLETQLLTPLDRFPYSNKKQSTSATSRNLLKASILPPEIPA